MLPSSIPIPIPGGLHEPLPEFVKVAQHFDLKKITDLNAVVAEEFEKFVSIDLKGKSVAIGVGSRGIKQQPLVVKALIHQLVSVGANPFIIPAMGSHGGGTAEGQSSILAHYGYTETEMGVPIKSSLDVIELGRINPDVPVYCDKLATEADYIIVCNRIKPHTDFRALHESGLIKMLAIGMSKHAGATALHFHGMQDFSTLMPAAAKVFLDSTPVLFGVAMVENPEENLKKLEFVPPNKFFERDAALLELAKSSIPRLMFDAIDVLVIDEIGKDISGAGMDPNVTGRPASGLPGFDDASKVNRIMVRNLTDLTEGNATGIGVADVTTQTLVKKIDWTKVYVNIVTAGVLEGARLPIVANTDQDALGIALRGCIGVHSKNSRIVRIKNTLEMTTVWASEALLPEVEKNSDQELISDLFDIQFDENGAITSPVM